MYNLITLSYRVGEIIIGAPKIRSNFTPHLVIALPTLR